MNTIYLGLGTYLRLRHAYPVKSSYALQQIPDVQHPPEADTGRSHSHKIFTKTSVDVWQKAISFPLC